MDSFGTIVLPNFGSPVRVRRPGGDTRWPGGSATKRARLETRVGVQQQRKKMAAIGSHRTSYSRYDVSYVRCPRPIYKQLIRQPDIVNTGTTSGVLSCGVGRQSWTDLYFPFNYSQMTDVRQYCLRQYTALTGLTSWDTTGATLPTPDIRNYQGYAFIRNWKGEFVFKNTTTTQVRMFLYDLVCKTDSGSFESNSKGAAITSTPQNLLYDGIEGDINTADDVSGFADLLHIQPHLAHVAISSAWKIGKLTQIILEPGELHIHKFYYAPHWMYPMFKIKNEDIASNPIQYLAGLTHCVSVQLMGTPAYANDATVTTSDAKVMWTMRAETRFKPIPWPTTQLYGINATADYTTTLAATAVVNPDTAVTAAVTHVP